MRVSNEQARDYATDGVSEMHAAETVRDLAADLLDARAEAAAHLEARSNLDGLRVRIGELNAEGDRLRRELEVAKRDLAALGAKVQP